MQFLVSRLATPTLVDFDEDGRNDALSVNDQITSLQPLCSSMLPSVGPQQRDNAEKVYNSDVANCSPIAGQRQKHAGLQAARASEMFGNSIVIQSPQADQKPPGVASIIPSVAQQPDLVSRHTDCAPKNSFQHNMSAEPQLDYNATPVDTCGQASVSVKSHCAGKSCCVSSDTESTMSLNELLDACCRCSTDLEAAAAAGETFESGSDVDACSQPPTTTVSHLCEIVNILHVSTVDPDTACTDGIPPHISKNCPGLNSSRPIKVVCNGQSESTSAMHADRGVIQHSFAESNLSSSSSSSDKAHMDEGYHSHATSALSHDATAYDDAV